MKKFFAFAALAAVVLGACTKNEVVERTPVQSPIVFGVYSGRMADTKATYADITIDSLKKSTDGFGVMAYYTMKDDWEDVQTTAQPNFMYNQQVKFNIDANTTLYPAKWEYTPIKYWPNGQNDKTDGVEEYAATTTSADKITFFAYAPHTATTTDPSDGEITLTSPYPAAGQGITGLSKANAEDVPKVYFTVPENAKEQIDLLWATPQYDKTKMGLTTKVAFVFHHALAKLNYQVQAVVDAASPTTNNLTNDYDATLETNETMIILKELVIEADGAKTGTLELATGTWTRPGTPVKSVITYDIDAFNFGKAIVSEYNASSNAIAIEPVTGYKGFQVRETADDLNSHIAPMIIPGTITSGNLKVIADYYVITKDPALFAGHSIIENKIAATNGSAIEFEGGKKYNMLVRIGLNSVDFDVTSIDTWGDGVGGAIDLPYNY